jgi:hypothetical protein
MRAARREYGNIGTVHLFTAVPAGLVVLIGQLLNTFGTVQTYEHVNIDGSGCYRPAALLRSCAAFLMEPAQPTAWRAIPQ